jgi:hypothetical protein
MSQFILASFDPTGDWPMQLQQFPPPAIRENALQISRHIHDLLQTAKNKDASRHGTDPVVSVQEERAFFKLFSEKQNSRCAVTANLLSCTPLQFNTMRCARAVLLLRHLL